jgi:transglutaminase/protease-like cytokinesis protein 3
MKKLALAVLVVLIIGCSSLQSIFDDLSGNDTANGTNRTQETSSSRNNAAQASSSPQRATSYVLPVSYETAYTYRTDTPDPKMKNIPRNIEANRVNNPDEYIRQIVAYINENSVNDFERVKKAHDLVALLVRYDAANFWANTVPAQDFRSVLKSKLAVCEGYSNLFKKLCDDLQIKCEIVHGFGRGVGTSPFSGDTPTNSNHAWNIVTINNESYLIDCTWDSGYMDGRVSKQEYTTDWLFLKPEQFLCSHFPENQRQQSYTPGKAGGLFL